MNVFDYLYFILLLITYIFYLFHPGSKRKYIQLVRLVLLVWLLATAIAVWLYRYAGLKNNLFLFHIVTPVEFCILMSLFRHYVSNVRAKKFIVLYTYIFVFLCVIFSIFIQKPNVNNSYVTVIESISMILGSLYFLREIMLLQHVKLLYRYPMFWISSGILFYYAGTLIIEGMLNYLIIHSIELAKKAYRISYVIKYFLFILLLIAVYCDEDNANIRRNENVN